MAYCCERSVHCLVVPRRVGPSEGAHPSGTVGRIQVAQVALYGFWIAASYFLTDLCLQPNEIRALGRRRCSSTDQSQRVIGATWQAQQPRSSERISIGLLYKLGRDPLQMLFICG